MNYFFNADNPRGLYPKGGGCRFCGSVEHLKNDCVRKVQKDGKAEIRVARNTFGDSLEEEHGNKSLNFYSFVILSSFGTFCVVGDETIYVKPA